MIQGEISVIIPAYNRESLIGPTLESLLGQTKQAMEIIVVDDGSTDDTAGIASSFGPVVRVIHQKNQGPAAARNNGFRESRGDFIHFFDSDDIAVPNKHEVQLKTLLDNDADIAYGAWIKGTFSGKSFTPVNGVFQQSGLPDGDLVRALLCNWSIVPHACLFRRSIVELAGGFPEDLFVGEDQFMFLRCLLAGAKVVHSSGTLEMYRVENTDKITASAEGSVKRLVEWGRFLVKANESCQNKGFNPAGWFDFQRRVYGAYTELEEVSFEGKSKLMEELSKLFIPGRSILYKISGFCTQKRQGLEMRFTGLRGSRDFMAGKLSVSQLQQIHLSGYSISAYK